MTIQVDSQRNVNTKERVKKAIVVIRCSSKPQLEKYGPTSQLRDVNESLQYFPKGPVALYRTIQIQESASGWNRKKWEPTMDECLREYKEGKAQVVIFPRADRESRFLAGSYPKLLEVIKSGMLVYFALERLWLDPNNPDSFEEYQRLVLEAQAYIRVLRRNTTKGKRECAEAGKIPSGLGRYGGYLGLRYDKSKKIVLHIPGQIEVATEILNRVLNGEKSSSRITVDLQNGRVRGIGGNLIQRSAVNRVLAHAKVYAGVIEWNGIEIRGKVEDPVITEEQATIIAKRLERNKELSHGFGRRKPETGRIFCGLCGRRYNLDSRKGCRCNGSDPRNPIKCPAPKLGLKKLVESIYQAVFTTFMDDETLLRRTAELRERWEKETAGIEEKLRDKEERLATFDQRRRLLSFQHESGGLTDDEYVDRLEAIEKEKVDFTGQMAQLSRFTPAEEPPRPEDVRQALVSTSSVWGNLLCKVVKAAPFIPIALTKGEEQEKKLDELYEWLDLKAIVYPGDNGRFKLDVFVNIPIQRKEACEKVMVSPSSLYYARQRQPPPGLA